ncbi:MAG: hypothetical protein ACRCTZ_08230 [Sarcina sp.]
MLENKAICDVEKILKVSAYNELATQNKSVEDKFNNDGLAAVYTLPVIKAPDLIVARSLKPDSESCAFMKFDISIEEELAMLALADNDNETVVVYGELYMEAGAYMDMLYRLTKVSSLYILSLSFGQLMLETFLDNGQIEGMSINGMGALEELVYDYERILDEEF